MRALQCPNRFLIQFCALCTDLVYLQTLKKYEEPKWCIASSVVILGTTIHDVYVWVVNNFAPKNNHFMMTYLSHLKQGQGQGPSMPKTSQQSLHKAVPSYLDSTTSSVLPMNRRDQTATLRSKYYDTSQGQEGKECFDTEAQT